MINVTYSVAFIITVEIYFDSIGNKFEFLLGT